MRDSSTNWRGLIAWVLALTMLVLSAWIFLNPRHEQCHLLPPGESAEGRGHNITTPEPPRLSDSHSTGHRESEGLNDGPSSHEPEIQIELRTVDVKGLPVGDVDLTVADGSRVLTGRSDESGRWRIGLARLSDSIEISAVKVGFLDSRREYPPLVHTIVQLKRHVPVRGFVYDESSRKGIAGAQVVLKGARHENEVVATTLSDSAGKFVFETGSTELEDACVTISCAGYASQRVTVPYDAKLDACVCAVALDYGKTITGSVVDFEQGTPIEGATIATGDKIDTGVRSDAAGRFGVALRPDLSGSLLVGVQARGYCAVQVLFAPADLADARIRLPKLAYLDGYVVDAQGHPAPSVEVTVDEDRSWELRARARGDVGVVSPLDALRPSYRFQGESPWFVTKTDESGYFKSTGLTPWSSRLLIAAASDELGRASTSLQPGPGSGSTERVRLVLTAPSRRRVFGTVSWNGAPAPARVSWTGRAESGTTHTDASCNYSLNHVENGIVQLECVPDICGISGLSSFCAKRAVSIGDGCENECRHDFALEMQLAVIGGCVRTSAGAPVVGAVVTIRGCGGLLDVHDFTDSTGAFRLNVPVDCVGSKVIVSWRGHSVIRTGVNPGDESLQIIFPIVRACAFRVLDAVDGKAVRAEIYYRASGSQEYSQLELAPAGVEDWRTCDLPSGEVDVQIRCPKQHYKPLSYTIFVKDNADDANRFEARVDRSSSLVLRFTGDPKVTLPSSICAIVELQSASEVQYVTGKWKGPANFPGLSFQEERCVVATPGATRSVEGLSVGEYFIAAEPGMTVDPQRIRVTEEHEVVDVALRLAPR